jgi:uncharacterized protein YjiS (DUF1127 family)
MPTQLAERSIPGEGRSAGEGILPHRQSIFSRPLRAVAGWLVRRSLRRALRELAQDGRLHGDVGLDRDQALREAVKPFWRR